MLTVRLD